MENARSRYLLMGIAVFSFFVPVIIYFIIYAGVPAATPEEALAKLTRNEKGWILLDVQSRENFKSYNITGSKNIPISEILKAEEKSCLPEEIRSGNLLVICESGFSSAYAVKKLRELSVSNVFHIDGGIIKWRALACAGDNYCSLSINEESAPFPFIPMPMYEQVSVILAAFFVKPIYMLLSFFLIILLRKNEEDDLKIFKWAMIFFFTGEAFCTVNYLFFNEESYFVEYLHMSGMVLGFGLTVFAVIKGLDERIFHIRRIFNLYTIKEAFPYNFILSSNT